MRELTPLLQRFRDALGVGAVVWTRRDPAGAPRVTAAAPRLLVTPELSAAVAAVPPDGAPHAVATPAGDLLVCSLAPGAGALAGVGPLAPGAAAGPPALALLRAMVDEQLRVTREVELAANELAERYEEINLLYTTSEILGRTVSLAEAAGIILTEISETVGARRAAILVHDRVTDTLQAVAALGAQAEDVPPLGVDDAASVSARVFRTHHPTITDAGEQECEAERAYREGAMLSVPILWSAPDGSTALGVVNLSGRRHGHPFTAGDQKLVAAIAAQIGTAIQNARLVRASLAQQRLVQEMQLAHDLQMRLLPACGIVAPEATVDARVLPADSVGGDFYHLFRLGEGRTGVMIGDVSGHGYRAALIMALVMSAAAIHAQSTSEPGAMLCALLASLREELESTEMYLTVFYGVIDRPRGELRYANAGHPHAFVLRPGAAPDRLHAKAPPLGMVDDAPPTDTVPWSADDTLLLFTDGLPDARDRHGLRLGEEPVLAAAVAAVAAGPARVVEQVLTAVNLHAGDASRRDDITLVVARS